MTTGEFWCAFLWWLCKSLPAVDAHPATHATRRGFAGSDLAAAAAYHRAAVGEP